MDRDLENLKEQIISLVHPRKIILFGSRANGTANDQSDYDILILMQNGTNKRAIAQFLYQNIENIDKPYDFIVATEETIEKYSNSPHLVYFHALKDGIELYAS
ncbi:nucleotidyltransferase domain-containing protein [Leptospira noguchii]|uniref:nucleotidyltransferase domain-containing protein n=1 Tax=Leptospira noguchii TaxID=28182 RepID=UPI000248A2BE|nr:nucleotidyltransferase domain-containing protein [Leptospira noguchii]EMS89599.1 nucleotidyltransferase domain protein [Leptospira noguchii str. Cascata]UOG29486.1 nucleotidyltransferase domain-containing protein [Leptospira noguchii]UOG36900.1 nucleotidyltransferase domain-containing protein [Leptospira noguchii]